MPEPLMNDVDLNEELEKYESKEGEDDTGLISSDNMDKLPGPVTTEGEVTIPPKPPIKEDVIEKESEDITKEDDEESFRTFKTEDEYNAFVEKQRRDALESVKPKEKEESEEPLKFFDDKWQPENWNDYTSKLIENPIVRKKLVDSIALDIKGVLEDLSKKDQAEIDNINKEYDKEYNEIAKKGLLPKLGTKEGQVINKQISKIGADYGILTLSKAYEVWSKMPKEHGGGLGYVVKKDKIADRKKMSGLIGSQRKGSDIKASKKDSYEHVHSKDMDELIAEEFDE